MSEITLCYSLFPLKIQARLGLRPRSPLAWHALGRTPSQLHLNLRLDFSAVLLIVCISARRLTWVAVDFVDRQLGSFGKALPWRKKRSGSSSDADSETSSLYVDASLTLMSSCRNLQSPPDVAAHASLSSAFSLVSSFSASRSAVCYLRSLVHIARTDLELLGPCIYWYFWFSLTVKNFKMEYEHPVSIFH